MNEKLRALNRFGLGARIGAVDALATPRLWLHEQMDAGGAEADALSGLPDLDGIEGVVAALREAQRSREQAAIAGTFDLTGAQANRVFPGSDDVRGRWDIMG